MRFILLSMALISPATGLDERSDPHPPTARLAMTKGVVCKDVRGFGDFEVRTDAALTADEKLTVYYEPSGYAIEKTKDGYRALFVQDARIRKRDSKDVLWKKDKMFKYEAKSETPPYRVFMRTDLGLKGLPVGEYDLDVILHDGLHEKKTTTQTIRFKVIAESSNSKS